MTCIDLTTLSGDDTEANVQRLCLKAAKPLRADILAAIGMEDIGLNVGAVCVYPSRCVISYTFHNSIAFWLQIYDFDKDLVDFNPFP